jgi:hypothetical protein
MIFWFLHRANALITTCLKLIFKKATKVHAPGKGESFVAFFIEREEAAGLRPKSLRPPIGKAPSGEGCFVCLHQNILIVKIPRTKRLSYSIFSSTGVWMSVELGELKWSGSGTNGTGFGLEFF